MSNPGHDQVLAHRQAWVGGIIMHEATFLSEILTSLDLAVVECLDNGSYQAVGCLPAWFSRLYPEALSASGSVRLGETSPFLENFLIDAAYFWRQQETGRLRSGPWQETDSSRDACALEASALCVSGRKLLCIERLGMAYEESQAILQRARENRLDYHRLQRAEAALAKSHDNLLALLNELRLGTVMLDEAGRITFLSQMCQRLLGSQEEVVGQFWEEVSPFSAQTKTVLQAMGDRPAHRRTKVPVHLETPEGQRYWMDIEVQDDPRDPRGKIICLYDMTEVHDLRRLLDEKSQFHELIGKSEPMLRIYQQIRDLARVDTTVLIEGETGTGKELVAQAIHAASQRQHQPFMAVNSAGLTESLLASQLFGHRRGAFTGAVTDQQGLLEAAHGGTLFLDEIGDIPLSVQISLLRVLQEREIMRLGESRPRKINVRILAATNRNLQAEADLGNFRADLLYRIRVARVRLPALRERRQDIPLLVGAFLSQCRATMGKPVQDVSHSAMALLLRYAWPGNVRELKSAIEFAVIHCRGPVIQAEDLPPECHDAPAFSLLRSETPDDEKQRLLTALTQARGNRTIAARLLGMSRATFYRRLANLHIAPKE
jgi:transcriptional regulator with PAS, ATPase and Fis domain